MSGLMSRSSDLVDEVAHRRALGPLERAPALERPHERDLVGVLEVAADRDAPGDPGDEPPRRR